LQAHRIISQIVFTGARVFGRAFAEAYKQASASQVRIPYHTKPLPPSGLYKARNTKPQTSKSHTNAIQLQRYAAHLQQNPTSANTLTSSGLTLDEACRILNVPPPKSGAATTFTTTAEAASAAEQHLNRVHEQFKRLFDMNDPKGGGSFYLQSKVLRARERIELEVREAAARVEREEEIRGGWKPRVYRN